MINNIFNFIIELDNSLFLFINQTIQNVFFDFLMPMFRNKFTWIPVYILLILLYYKKFKFKAVYPILFLIVCVALTDSICHHFLKPFFGRPRPCFNEWIQVRLLTENCGGKWSFPSIHAANHFGLSLGIILSKLFAEKIWNFLLLLWAFLIGFAQIYVGIHYPIDILGGFFIGGLITYVVYKVLYSEKVLSKLK